MYVCPEKGGIFVAITAYPSPKMNSTKPALTAVDIAMSAAMTNTIATIAFNNTFTFYASFFLHCENQRRFIPSRNSFVIG